MESFPHPNYIDLFAGCGGISLGLYNAGWRGVFALEKSKMAFVTLKHNLIDRAAHFDWPKWLPVSEHDIVDVLTRYSHELSSLKGSIDLVTGGPPCQGFSLAGRRDERDKRNSLADSYIKFVSLVKPSALFFENVRGFTFGFGKEDTRSEAYSNRVLKELQALGYLVKDEIVDSSEFGVPQARKRYILVGLLSGNSDDFFAKLHDIKGDFLRAKGLDVQVTLKEAISDLERRNGERISPEFRTFKEGIYGKTSSPYQELMRKGSVGFPDSHRFANHRKTTVKRFEYVLANCPKGKPLGDEIRAKFGLKKKTVIPLDEDGRCPTLTTLPDDYIHYSEPRILTVREYARIQSFSDCFEFKSNYTTGGGRRRIEVPRYTQVGNAVPPLFSELCGAVLRTVI
jgi:DNA (cytosine-5)-methyltransferase 1